jgi:hypothetical protein
MSESNNSKDNTTTPKADSQQAEVNKILRRDNEEFKIVKKLPKRFPTNYNDVYVTNKTDFKAQLERCSSILYDTSGNTEANEIVLHAIGPAINTYVIFYFFEV